MEELIGEEKEQECRKYENSLENSRLYTYLILFLLGKLHFYPSSFSNFQIKSLNFQFNQFNPCPYDISITKYFS